MTVNVNKIVWCIAAIELAAAILIVSRMKDVTPRKDYTLILLGVASAFSSGFTVCVAAYPRGKE